MPINFFRRILVKTDILDKVGNNHLLENCVSSFTSHCNCQLCPFKYPPTMPLLPFKLLYIIVIFSQGLHIGHLQNMIYIFSEASSPACVQTREDEKFMCQESTRG